MAVGFVFTRSTQDVKWLVPSGGLGSKLPRHKAQASLRTPKDRSRLKIILQPKLHLPVIDDCGADAPEVRGAEDPARGAELGRIEKIERLVAELQPAFLSHR